MCGRICCYPSQVTADITLGRLECFAFALSFYVQGEFEDWPSSRTRRHQLAEEYPNIGIAIS